MNIKCIITDFDGTLFDTVEANITAYHNAITKCYGKFDNEAYRNNFGLRFDDMMKLLNIPEVYWDGIKKEKAEQYKMVFDKIRPNNYLIPFIKYQKDNGMLTAIATTASRNNVLNIVRYFKIENLFDYIITGEDVKHGKPDPEVYNLTMQKLNVKPENTLIFEDSEVGIQAAEASGAHVYKVKL